SMVDVRAEMPQEAMRLILRYVAASGRTWETMPADAPVFLAMPTRGAYKQPIAARGDTMRKRLKVYLQRAGLDPAITIHSFRHGGAQARYEAGQDIRSIQHALGHTSLATTDTYLRTLVGTEDEAPATIR